MRARQRSDNRRRDRAGYHDQPMDVVVALLQVAADLDPWLEVCWQRKVSP